MRHLLLASLLLAAACGDKSSSSTLPADDRVSDMPGPDTPGRMAAPGTILGDPAVYDLLTSSTLPLPAGGKDLPCNGDEPTLGAQVKAWQTQMGGTIAANCDGTRCTVTLASTLDPSCDTNAEQDGCDGSSYTIEFDRAADGSIEADTLKCVAAG